MPALHRHLIVGLGNPGNAYAQTRHNIGFMVVESLARKYRISLDQEHMDARYGSGAIEGVSVVLLEPLSYMNRSGIPVRASLNKFSFLSHEMIVIHDDVDLAFGIFKIKEKGGHAGHKGLKSILECIGLEDFVRLRIGVGRPKTGQSVADHVLASFDPEETRILDQVIHRAREAVITLLTEGTKAGMNRFNRKGITISSEC